ncbi:T9SS type A sorting domain-containing protein [Pontibacter sp. HJ8]
MKAYLRLLCVVLVAVMSHHVALAQLIKEPTINSTLDIIEIIKVNAVQEYDLFIDAGDRSGELVKVRMRLLQPAQRDLFEVHYNTNVETPTFVKAEFGEDGIAILGAANANIALKDMQVYMRTKIAQPGTYKYVFDLLRGDNNVIATVTEEVTVAETVPARIGSTLNQNPNLIKGADTDFTINLSRGEVAADTPVRIRITLNNKAQAGKLAMQFQEGQVYKPLAFNQEGIALYGPEAGFALTNARLNFKANFTDAVNYGYKLELLKVGDNAVLATRNETAAVMNVAGLGETIGNEFVKVYPTLATEGFVILEMGSVHNAQVQVLDALGRTVLTADNLSGSNRLSTSGFAKGLYFIKVIKDTEVAGGRFIVR